MGTYTVDSTLIVLLVAVVIGACSLGFACFVLGSINRRGHELRDKPGTAFRLGLRSGEAKANKESYDKGYAIGHQVGLGEGWDRGYAHGMDVGATEAVASIKGELIILFEDGIKHLKGEGLSVMSDEELEALPPPADTAITLIPPSGHPFSFATPTPSGCGWNMLPDYHRTEQGETVEVFQIDEDEDD